MHVPSAPADLRPGTRVGRYQVLAEIARGGMATVYLGRLDGPAGFERLIAIKCCHPALARQAEFVAMFLDEARLAAGIRHPNVVATLDVGALPEDVSSLGSGEGRISRPFLVMEYVEGATLAELLRAVRARGERLPVPVVLRIAIDALSGLHAAHEQRDAAGRSLGLVHRDVSPQNLLVGRDGTTRVADFGVARALTRAVVTADGGIRGKFGYLSPEQVLGQAPTRASDLFALGIVLWESLTGQRLFSGDSEAAIVQRTLHESLVAPSAARGEPLPDALDRLVLRALERRPAQRPSDAAAFAAALEELAPASPRQLAAYLDAALGDLLRARAESLRAARAALAYGPGQEGPGERGEEPPARAARRALLALAGLGGLGGAGLLLALLGRAHEPAPTGTAGVPAAPPRPERPGAQAPTGVSGADAAAPPAAGEPSGSLRQPLDHEAGRADGAPAPGRRRVRRSRPIVERAAAPTRTRARYEPKDI